MKTIIIKLCMVTTHMLKIHVYFKIILIRYVNTRAKILFLLQRIYYILRSLKNLE